MVKNNDHIMIRVLHRSIKVVVWLPVYTILLTMLTCVCVFFGFPLEGR